MNPQSSPSMNVFDAAKAIVESLKGLDKEHQEQAIRFASESLGLQGLPKSHPSTGTGHSPPATPTPTTQPQVHTTDIKQFTEAKKPKTDTQFAAVAAYYYQFEAAEDQRKDTIGADDLKEAARLARRRRPGDAAQTLRNAKNAGYLDTAEPGRFRLSTVGENLVAVTLPGDGSGAASDRKKNATRKKRGKGGIKKSGATKKARSKKKRTSRGR